MNFNALIVTLIKHNKTSFSINIRPIFTFEANCIFNPEILIKLRVIIGLNSDYDESFIYIKKIPKKHQTGTLIE